jgi:hypothetical protein
VIEDQTVLSIVQLEYLRGLSSYLLTDPDTRKIATSSRGSEAKFRRRFLPHPPGTKRVY